MPIPPAGEMACAASPMLAERLEPSAADLVEGSLRNRQWVGRRVKSTTGSVESPICALRACAFWCGRRRSSSRRVPLDFAGA
jgi:hypothetical protein